MRTMTINYKNLLLNNSEKDWLLKIRSTLSKPKKIIVPTDEIWYTSINKEILTPINGSYGDATIISNTYENGKGIIRFDREITSIGDNAFQRCTGLTSINIPNSVTSIGSSVFQRCTGLTSITIPDSVTSIGEVAFESCTDLTSVIIPNNVTSIGGSAFYNCTGLTSINIPNSVTSIGSDAFGDVLNINYNGTATGSPWGAKCINGYIENDIVYTNNTKTQLVGISKLYSGSINIPGSVTSIGEGAFSGCKGLTSINLPNSVISIENYAFYNCTGLTNINIPNSVNNIGSDAFYNCKGLTSINIPDSVTSIRNQAFFDVLNINYNGTATGSPWGAKCINGYIENDIVYTNNTKTQLVGISTSYSGSITIPNSVTSIGISVFRDCKGLTSINIPDTVTSIGTGAFRGCTGLTTINIPNSVTNIGYRAFKTCTGLASITISSTTPPTLDREAFDDTNDSPIYVPSESVEAYTTASNWSTYASRIQAIQ